MASYLFTRPPYVSDKCDDRLNSAKTFSASQIYELGEDKENTMDFAEAIDSSDLEEFGFTDSFIFELWGAITDAKSGRL